MSYTLGAIRQRVLVDKLDDDTFDPQVVDNFINDTQRDIFLEYELPFQEKIYSGTIPLGVTRINLPDDISVIQSQIITAADGSQTGIGDYYLPFREFNKRFPTPGNNPARHVGYWTSYGGKMLLSNPTNAEYTMDLYYIKTPKTLVADGDVPEIPEEFSELLVLGAFARVQSREGDSDEALVTEQKYQRLLEKLVQRYGFREANGVVRMRNRQVGR